MEMPTIRHPASPFGAPTNAFARTTGDDDDAPGLGRVAGQLSGLPLLTSSPPAAPVLGLVCLGRDRLEDVSLTSWPFSMTPISKSLFKGM